jgi:antitoxin (DNA-binding transcriptional repressor) of toxin-antitoxin stability system
LARRARQVSLAAQAELVARAAPGRPVVRTGQGRRVELLTAMDPAVSLAVPAQAAPGLAGTEAEQDPEALERPQQESRWAASTASAATVSSSVLASSQRTSSSTGREWC